MVKGKLVSMTVVSAIFLVLFLNLVSADLTVREEIDKSYITDTETVTYREDLRGGNKGFSLILTSTSPKYNYLYEDEYPYITWGYIRPSSYRNYNSGNYGFFERDRSYLDSAFNTYKLGRDSYSRYPSYRYGYYGYSYPSYGYGYQRNYW